jgi:hypothetical protein
VTAEFSRLVGIDFEATHVEPGRGWAWQWGLSQWENLGCGWVEMQRSEGLIGPPRHYKTERFTREINMVSLEVCGDPFAVWESIKGRCCESDIHLLAQALERSKGPLVAYNAAADMGYLNDLAFLASEWHDYELGVRVPLVMPNSSLWIDVQAVARSRWPGERNSLDSVLARLGLNRASALHGAKEDASLAVQALLLLQGEEIAKAMSGGANA